MAPRDREPRGGGPRRLRLIDEESSRARLLILVGVAVAIYGIGLGLVALLVSAAKGD